MPPLIDSGDTAWVLTASALVLMMTLPGLALFYGGLVRAKNVLNVLMQCFAAAAIVGVLWVLVGYSLAFGDGNAFIGDLSKVGLLGITIDSVAANFASPPRNIPEYVFVAFQGDVRDHHAGADHRRRRRAHEIQGVRWRSSRSGCSSCTARSRTWSGRQGWIFKAERDRLRGRPRGAHVERLLGPGRRARARQARGLRQGADAAAQPAACV